MTGVLNSLLVGGLMLHSEIAIILKVVYKIICSQYPRRNSCTCEVIYSAPCYKQGKVDCSYSSNSTDIYATSICYQICVFH